MDRENRYVPALGYNFLTPVYDRVVRLTTREDVFKSKLVAQTAMQAGHRILDVACGTGTLALGLKRACPEGEVCAIDGDDTVLAIARAKAATGQLDIHFEKALSDALPFPDKSFDRVTSSLFFHHLDWNAKLRTAREILRVLRPGGQFHLADWGRATGPLMRAAFLGIQLLDGFENTRDNVAGRLPELLEETGFTNVEEAETISTLFGTMALYRANRLGE